MQMQNLFKFPRKEVKKIKKSFKEFSIKLNFIFQ